MWTGRLPAGYWRSSFRLLLLVKEVHAVRPVSPASPLSSSHSRFRDASARHRGSSTEAKASAKLTTRKDIVFEPLKALKSISTTTLELYQNRKLPTDSAE